MRRIKALLIKELTQIRRDKKLFGVLVAAPLIQLLILGYAATTDVKDISIAIRDYSNSNNSREYVRAVGSSGYFQVYGLTGNEQKDPDEIMTGKAGMILVIPADFDDKLEAGLPAPVQVLADGSDNNYAVQGLAYLQKATRQYSEKIVMQKLGDNLQRHGMSLPAVNAETRTFYNPDLKSTYFMVPGLFGLLLLVTTMMVGSMALVKEREDGTMEQLIVTPLRVGEIVIGKLLPFVVIGLIVISVVFPAMLIVFKVPFRGNVFLLYGFSLLFLMTTIGLGLLISTIVKTQQQAMLMAGFFVMMPFAMLSGFIFPVENMPQVMQYVAAAIPLKYYLEAVRGIFLKGVGVQELWSQAVILMVLGAAILSLAIMKFHRKLD